MVNGTDAFSHLIETAVESAMRRVIGITDISPRRLIKVADASKYLALSEREIYNMLLASQFMSMLLR